MKTLLLLLVVCTPAFAGKLPLGDYSGKGASTETPPTSAEDLKLKHRFGLGVSGGGPLSLLGIEADVNVQPEFAITLGLGTGIDYSTFMVKARYFLLGEWVSPYLGGGVARWWTDGTKATNLSPSVLANRFLTPSENPANGFDVWMFYPCLGVQFMSRYSFDFFAEVEYLFRFFSFAGGTYAGLGMHWYF